MYNLKGFLAIQPLTNNDPGIISPIGELSTYSKTFSKDIGYYSGNPYPAIDLFAFHSVRDGVAVKLDPSFQSTILSIGDWLYTQALAGLFTDATADVSAMILTEFADSITDLNIGDMVQGDVATIYLPQFIQFKIITDGAEENNIRLWLSDDAFRRQYDEFTIEVVPPIDTMDDFFRTTAEVKALIEQYDDTARQLRIQDKIGSHPPTTVRVDMYDWTNPLEPTYSVRTPWAVVIYGPFGNNIDTIKGTLVDFILNQSQHTRSEWEELIPDLFKSTEFIITPFWNNYSIPNESLVKGLHSPTIRVKDITAVAQATATRYDSAHVNEMVCTSVSNFRSISFTGVGGPDNRDGIYVLSEKFPDYVTLSTSSTEFGRMSPRTQAWSTLLAEMLYVADDMTEFSDVPLGMTRLIRDGVMYLVSTFDDVQYLVVSRMSYVELFGSPEIDPAAVEVI